MIEGKKEPADQSKSKALPADQLESSTGVSHVTTLRGHQAPITTLSFSEAGVLLASGCKAGSVRVWDLKVSWQFFMAVQALVTTLAVGGHDIVWLPCLTLHVDI